MMIVVTCAWFPCEAHLKKTITVMISHERSFPFCKSGEAALKEVKMKLMDIFGKKINLDIDYVVSKGNFSVENDSDNSSNPILDS